MSEKKPIQIFSNLNENIGVNVIKSPVKLTILEMLRDSEMEFDEIVSNTGKSKSTVSVHLKSLRENGIISYRLHPVDNRKKIFYINSKYIGSVRYDRGERSVIGLLLIINSASCGIWASAEISRM